MICIPFFLSIFFFNNTTTTEIYTLSLHDALPISGGRRRLPECWRASKPGSPRRRHCLAVAPAQAYRHSATAVACLRSEEHTSELQSHSDLVCRLLLEKKKNDRNTLHQEK